MYTRDSNYVKPEIIEYGGLPQDTPQVPYAMAVEYIDTITSRSKLDELLCKLLEDQQSFASARKVRHCCCRCSNRSCVTRFMHIEVVVACVQGTHHRLH